MTRKSQEFWTELRRRLIAWQDYQHSRFELRNQSDRTLRDIGLTRGGKDWMT